MVATHFSLVRSFIWFCSLGAIALTTGCGTPQAIAPEQPPTASPPAAKATTTSTSKTAPSPEATSEPGPVVILSYPANSGDIWSRLQQPDNAYFVLMRHALAPGTGDPANFQLGDCTTQRNLSEEGREQARQTGAAFRQGGVAVEKVLSSEWCRCLETAELMALGSVEPFPPINSFFQDRTTEAAQTAQVQQFMQDKTDTPSVTVLVTHFVNTAALSGSGIGSGEMVVMQVDDENQLAVVGEISPF